MKKTILSIAGVLALAVMLVSCQGGSPKAAAEKWLNSFYHMDYAAAKEVSTEETKKQLESFESLMGMMQQNAKEDAKKIKVSIKDAKTTSDTTANVEYTLSNDPSPKTLKMVKQHGKWLAQWSKMDMGGTGGGAGAGADMNNGGGAMGATPDTMMAPPADATMGNGAAMDTTAAH